MQEFIARENIRRFEAQLKACTDPEQRETLVRLLNVERKHLEEALAEKQAMKNPSSGQQSPIA